MNGGFNMVKEIAGKFRQNLSFGFAGTDKTKTGVVVTLTRGDEKKTVNVKAKEGQTQGYEERRLQSGGVYDLRSKDLDKISKLVYEGYSIDGLVDAPVADVAVRAQKAVRPDGSFAGSSTSTEPLPAPAKFHGDVDAFTEEASSQMADLLGRAKAMGRKERAKGRPAAAPAAPAAPAASASAGASDARTKVEEDFDADIRQAEEESRGAAGAAKADLGRRGGKLAKLRKAAQGMQETEAPDFAANAALLKQEQQNKAGGLFGTIFGRW
jgi:hypothetical protein